MKLEELNYDGFKSWVSARPWWFIKTYALSTIVLLAVITFPLTIVMHFWDGSTLADTYELVSSAYKTWKNVDWRQVSKDLKARTE